MLHRTGTGALHHAPDALSRHPEGREKLILARANEWDLHRAVIRGVQAGILSAEFDDDEPVLVLIADLPQEALEPVPFAVLQAAGVGTGKKVDWASKGGGKGR